MKLKVKDILPFLAIVVIFGAFFWKIIFKGYVAVPADLLTGAYYPWYEYNYGYPVHVPVKNPLISDSFDQFFVWKKIIVDSYKSAQWPLWNPYSYSGYPLLANFHSSALNPLNIFLLLPKNFNVGWNLYVTSGILFSIITMYLLLKHFNYGKFPCLIGAITYGFSGFAICWLEFATADQAMIWLPLLILLIEKYFDRKNYFWLMSLSPILYMLTTAGHFQIAVYGYALTIIYFFFKLFNENTKHKLKVSLSFVIPIILGLSLSAIQLLPTLEITPLTIRFEDTTTANFNYGLLSLPNILTIFAPDFFGNPTTGNYWGSINYHETVIYTGLIALFALAFSLYNFGKLKSHEKFFLFIAITSLLFAFDGLGRLIYILHVPFLSTSGAGRIIAIFTYSISILTAVFASKIKDISTKTLIKNFLVIILLVPITFIAVYGLRYSHLVRGDSVYLRNSISNLSVSLRNLIFPLLLTFSFSVCLLFRKNKFFYIFLTAIVIIDVFRFGWKYEPFVPQTLVYPKTAIINYLTSQGGIFRVDKERGPLFPPNTWAYYGLMSPSGYDPVSLSSYSKAFFKDINGNNNISSRYAEISDYNSKALGDYNVKYLLALKRDDNGNISGNNILWDIDMKKWKKVFETSDVAVLENVDFKQRAYLENAGKNDFVQITRYSPEQVTIDYKSSKDDSLVILDTYYPGWTATVNGNEVDIEKYNNIFRKINVPKGGGVIIFNYSPKSFKYGEIISLVSFGTLLLMMIFYKKLNRVIL